MSVVLAFAVNNYANAKAAVNGMSVLVGAYTVKNGVLP